MPNRSESAQDEFVPHRIQHVEHHDHRFQPAVQKSQIELAQTAFDQLAVFSGQLQPAFAQLVTHKPWKQRLGHHPYGQSTVPDLQRAGLTQQARSIVGIDALCTPCETKTPQINASPIHTAISNKARETHQDQRGPRSMLP
jgi:hypothetical protein